MNTMQDNEYLKGQFESSANLDRKVMILGCTLGELNLIHSVTPRHRQTGMFLITDELSSEQAEQEIEPIIVEQLKARIEEGCEMYPDVQPTDAEEHHVDGLMRTLLRFNRRFRALDEESNLPRSKRIPHLKRGGYGRHPGRN